MPGSSRVLIASVFVTFAALVVPSQAGAQRAFAGPVAPSLATAERAFTAQLAPPPANARRRFACPNVCEDCVLFTDQIFHHTPGNNVQAPTDCEFTTQCFTGGCQPNIVVAINAALDAVDEVRNGGDLRNLARALSQDGTVVELNFERSAVQIRDCSDHVIANFPLAGATLRAVALEAAELKASAAAPK